MDLLVAVPVRLLPAFPLFDFRGVLELLFGDVHTVSAELLIVVQHRPGNRMMVRADAEKAPETQDRVGDAAAGFIDHKALDLPDALTVRVIDRSSFRPVACDQGGCSSVLRRGCALHCAHHSIVSLIASPCCSYETRCLGPDLIGGRPGALHSVASTYAAIALVALTVVNAGRPSSTRQCHGSEAAAHRRRIAERCMGRHLVRAEILNERGTRGGVEGLDIEHSLLEVCF